MATLFDVFDAEDGKRRRDEAIRAQVEAEENAAYRAKFEAEVLAQRGTFTSEDITKAIGLPRGAVGTNRNNLVGSLMHRLSADGVIVRCGSATSARVTSHAAHLALWKVVR